MKYLLISACMLGLVPMAHAGDITIQFSEKFSEKLTDELGEREGETLKKYLTKDLTQSFGASLETYGDIKVTIIDAKANRPTFKELGDTPGLSMSSFGIGGASLKGEVYSVDGELLATTEFKDYETDIRYARGQATWSDAKRTFDRFARKLAKAATENQEKLGEDTKS